MRKGLADLSRRGLGLTGAGVSPAAASTLAARGLKQLAIVAAWAKQLLAALKHLEIKQVIHCDIKTDNILLKHVVDGRLEKWLSSSTPCASEPLSELLPPLRLCDYGKSVAYSRDYLAEVAAEQLTSSTGIPPDPATLKQHVDTAKKASLQEISAGFVNKNEFGALYYRAPELLLNLKSGLTPKVDSWYVVGQFEIVLTLQQGKGTRKRCREGGLLSRGGFVLLFP